LILQTSLIQRRRDALPSAPRAAPAAVGPVLPGAGEGAVGAAVSHSGPDHHSQARGHRRAAVQGR
jgi:hypothetical protein